MKLDGIRVLDLSLFYPGPLLTQTMADHGAEVIDVEPPGGEHARHIGPAQDGISVWYRNMHRGKRSLCLDLKQDAGRELLLRLAETADVFVEGFRPGVVDRLGVGYQAIRAVNPKIVYCSISAFGQTGPLSKLPAHDMGIQALAGMLVLNQGQDGNPAAPSLPHSDIAAALFGLSGILMALLKAARTGEGDYLDIAMYDCLLACAPNIMGPVFAENRPNVPKQERLWGGNALYRLYRCADGEWLVLAGAEAKFANTLLTDLGRPDLIELASEPPGEAQQELRDFLDATFAAKPLDYWRDWLGARDLAWAPLLDLKQALASDHTAARGMLIKDAAGHPQLGPAIPFKNDPPRPNTDVARCGADNAALAAEAGFSDAAIRAMQESGALSG